MSHCYACHQPLRIIAVECPSCGLNCSGEFRRPRLARLPADMQRLAEQLLLSGGNLKEVAASEAISYPTLRKRVDSIIQTLEDLKSGDLRESDHLLAQVEEGTLHAEQATRLIAELNYGS